LIDRWFSERVLMTPAAIAYTDDAPNVHRTGVTTTSPPPIVYGLVTADRLV
jgi:hypothetical protein